MHKFSVGDTVELNPDDIFDGIFAQEDELEFLKGMGLELDVPYTISSVGSWEDGYDWVMVKGNRMTWSVERFKLVQPVNLENE